MNGNKYREELVELVKAAGQEVIDRASDLVGTGDLISDFDIWLRFPQDAVPEIQVNRTHINQRSFEVLINKEKDNG